MTSPASAADASASSAPAPAAPDDADRSPLVVVLAGGLSHERDVSIRSGRRVAESLRSTGLDVVVHDVDADLLPFLRDTRPDVVWPLLHGASGEDGSVRDVLEMARVPYVGTGPRASRVVWNKPIAKAALLEAGLATPDYVTLPQSLFRDLGAQPVLDTIVRHVGLPLVVKPTEGGSALGVSIVSRAEDLPRAMVECFAYGETALIERAIDGVELAVSVIDGPDGAEALPAVEIVAEDGYDYAARYVAGETEFFAPARLTREQATHVADVAVRAHRALRLRHLSRTDLILDGSGTAHVLEVNVAPGMTEMSLLPQAATASGRDLAELYRSIVDRALLPAR
ncbi:D-alanine--D-alanine ligase [Promicromonospora thailandica]|uniref:D-alanine--D-alanine ligase n=1 Tax=Promicromonospora thailandica TaxID=765201 RepID=A0A9X2G1P2_9MICO|nr:D-alanine--D-alanine ligase [Promicromonospora thailandica]MCP2265199.1 D-alanine-D-alanine ligase [Promicromonospora thailandica]BFF19720.1 D-alanine--D-alanine ligase [Promicromonospora thailandica]